MYTQDNKVRSLAELAESVKDGDTVAIGGGLSCREPMAAIREIIRQQRKNLKLVGSAHGIDVDMLCGAGAVSISGESYVGFEQDFGMAVNYRRACESGQVKVEDNCCYTLVQQLRAAISGLPFMPMRSVQGTDFMKLHPEFKTMECPYTGEQLVLVPALIPDVAVLHAHFADTHGNLHISGPPVADILFAKASRSVIATVEKIVEPEVLKEKGVTIPYFYVSGICEVSYGAHPTSCYPDYAYDREHTSLYYQQAQLGASEFHENYLSPFVFDCPEHNDYLDKVGGMTKLEHLQQWQQSPEQWRSLYAK